MAEDSELWDVICDGPYVPTKKVGDPPVTMPKTWKEYNDADRKALEKNFCAKKILVCGIGPDEYNMISACQSAKEIWEALQTAHERITQVKQSKIDMLTTENKLVRKILIILPSLWESKVNAITEAKDLQELTIDELIRNLKTYKMKKKVESESREPNKKKNLQEHFKYNPDKTAKRNPVPDKHFKRKRFADNVVKQALAARGDSSSESEEETSAEDKDALTLELGEAEQTRDDLVVCVVDLKETISNLENEKMVLTEKIASIEHERDDLELGAECRPGNSDKRKEVASEAHIKLENELNALRTSLCAELEKNRQLQAELERVKNDLEKSLKWTWSSKAITAIRLEHESFSLLNKLVQKDLVRGLSKSKFMEHKVCDACARGKHVKSSFNQRRITKDETFEVFVAFVKKIQVKMDSKVTCIRSDHGTEFDNAKFDDFCNENGITHNFSAPRTPQKNGVRSNKGAQDGEPLSVPGEVIDMANGKADMMSQVKEPSEDNGVSSAGEEPGATIATTKAEERVVDAIQGTPQVAERRM
ncbi:PREDICTED: uncharacterized protein LOC109213778 [Nicotiana attenuata]|uniref:uncharacterized protein LOC109213778 n=1 Tax=Nicotiana attenuata TaxID=49451 RepID=UPI0009055E21|nr:PREDICTED: uncharacterized protein LOC109213778 [Nicotiana attenuata]